jgi:hypothetical protein
MNRQKHTCPMCGESARWHCSGELCNICYIETTLKGTAFSLLPYRIKSSIRYSSRGTTSSPEALIDANDMLDFCEMVEQVKRVPPAWAWGTTKRVSQTDFTLQVMAAFGWKLKDECLIDGALYSLIEQVPGHPWMCLSIELQNVTSFIDLSPYVADGVKIGTDIVDWGDGILSTLSGTDWDDFYLMYENWVMSLGAAIIDYDGWGLIISQDAHNEDSDFFQRSTFLDKLTHRDTPERMEELKNRWQLDIPF